MYVLLKIFSSHTRGLRINENLCKIKNKVRTEINSSVVTLVLLNGADSQTLASQFPGPTLTYYLCGQLGSLLLKQVFHLLDVELLCLCFI